MDIISRSEAKARSLKYYFTGRPCKHGHIAPKFTSRGWCVECANLAMKDKGRKEYDREYYESNKDRIRERTKEYNRKNSKQRVQKAKEWCVNNPQKARIIKLSYKSRRRSIERQGDPTSEIAEWESKQKKVCYWCGDPCESNYNLDHYVPLAKGGSHSINNLVISCPHCNFSKNAKDPYEFAQTLGRLF